MVDLKKFIKANDLQFTDGRRNQDTLTFVGYALFKKCSKKSMEEALEAEFKKSSRTKEEFQRLYRYAKDNNYGEWWKGIEVIDEKIITAD